MKITLLSILLLLFSFEIWAQTFVPNYDESKMPAYTLPDPLVFDNGKPVRQAGDWRKEE